MTCPRREPGEPWPQVEPAAEAERRQRRQAARQHADPPLATLALGPFSTLLLARPTPLFWPDGEDGSAGAATRAAGGNGSGRGAPVGLPPLAPGDPAVQLAALLQQQLPGWAARLVATGEAADAACLRRWLAARGGCVEAAAVGVAAHLLWREGFMGAAGRVTEDSIAGELAARKAFLQGLDEQGCSVVLVQAARWVPLAAVVPPAAFRPNKPAACGKWGRARKLLR